MPAHLRISERKRSALGRRLIDALKKTYSNRIGIEYMGLGNPQMEAWVQKKIDAPL